MISKTVISFGNFKRLGPLCSLNHFQTSRLTTGVNAENNASNGGRTSAAVLQAKEKNVKPIEITLNPPKGTRDFYPEDQRLKNWLFGIWKNIAKQYGFEEYDAPIVEHVELYIRKAGEEVTQQLYDFEDKGGRKLSLRPEMTPSLARMILAKKSSLNFPLKWFAIPQCWRYERTTRGRRREHYQWNMDIFGVAGVEAEAELLSAIVRSLQEMGLTAKDVGIKINSRNLLNDLMAKVGIPPEKFIATSVLIDKLDKVSLDSLASEVEALGVAMDTMKQLTALLTNKSLGDYEVLLGPDALGIRELQQLFSYAKAYDIVDWMEFNPTIVRGLAYYTGIVFEGFDRERQFRAIFGGGRYDHLLQSFSTTSSVPAVGFGFGDAVIVELLKSKALLPEEQFVHPDVDIVAYGMAQTGKSLLVPLIQALRKEQVSVDFVLEDKKMKSIFQKANRQRAKYVMVLGEDEIPRQVITIKNMVTSEQIQCPIADSVNYLVKQLRTSSLPASSS